MDTEHPELGISILGINEFGYESGNGLATGGRDIPWLQDTQEQDVWSAWAIGFRDVVIVDALGVYYASYNLTTHNLSIEANAENLKSLLLEAAGYSD